VVVMLDLSVLEDMLLVLVVDAGAFEDKNQREWNVAPGAVYLALTERVQIGEGRE
jgi:hypothetical protein